MALSLLLSLPEQTQFKSLVELLQKREWPDPSYAYILA